MNYIKATLFILVVTIAFLFFSCEQGTEPEIIKPGRRDYTWSVDTVQIWGTYLMKMWGSSPTDVWAVGSGSNYNEEIWHYDGKEWKTDGVWRGIHPWCIYGFAKDDVWIAGSDGEIWHYDGNDWSRSLSYHKELNFKYERIYFMDIWGDRPNNVYAVGFADSIDASVGDVRFGIMMHYNGAKWSRVNIEFTKGILNGIKKGNSIRDKYFIHNLIQFPDSVKYYSFNKNQLTEIYFDIDHWHSLTIIDGEVVFTIDNGIYTYNNSKFNLIVKNPLPNNYQEVYGRNKKDIIWMMSDGLTHYNGIDFEYILEFDDLSLSDGAIFKNEVFFLTDDFNSGTNVIYHGILK